MGKYDPVSWEISEAALGPPAAAVTWLVERMKGEVYEETPYDAVKTVHDAFSDADLESAVPNLGEPFITAYLLEKEGVISPANDDERGEYRSLVRRRPPAEELRELFWEQERTLWWIGILTGVHPSLVTYWMYEEDIPLMERNYAAESMNQIREYREKEDK